MLIRHFLIPDYVLSFKCECCSECCKRWGISIDKQSVRKYEQLAVKDKDFSAMVAESIKKPKKGKAFIQLKNRFKKLPAGTEGEEKEIVEAMVCPFLDDMGLCTVQEKYGIEALCDVCKIFPRCIYLTERGYEMSLTYACANAAKTLKNKTQAEFYLDPEGFHFPDFHEQYGKIGNTLDRKKVGKVNYFEIEELLIDIMQFRGMDIDARLILTGIVVNKLKDGDLAGIKRYLANLDINLINQLTSVSSKPIFMMKLIKEAIDKSPLFQLYEKDITRLLSITYNELKFLDKAVISDEQLQLFLEGYRKYYYPFREDISHIYENYFVNFIFSKKYYTHKYLDAYFLMIFFYVLIRFFIISICIAEDRNVCEDTVVRVISAIDRSVSHNISYYEGVLGLIKKGDYHRLPYVISLINLLVHPAVNLGKIESG